MTPLQLAAAECANHTPRGCIKNKMTTCVVGTTQCPYLVETVFPMEAWIDRRRKGQFKEARMQHAKLEPASA
ncbi:MAG: hypothetical protein GY851_00450 [bacterium]|nr:hypothetical protein [bacterium]